ncbi:MAG: hypothetical protein AAGK22_10505 [Acidobacteriota bacterium]
MTHSESAPPSAPRSPLGEIIGSAAVAAIWPAVLALQSLDVSDPGLHLAQQLQVLHYGTESAFGLVGLSDGIGALWLALTADLGLYWVRFGWVLAVTMAIAIGAVTTVGSLPRITLLVGALATSTLLSARSLLILSYDSVAPLLLTLSAVLLVAALRGRSAAAIAAGGVAALALLSRLTVAPALALGLVPALFDRRGRRMSAGYLSGLAGASILLFLLLLSSQQLGAFLETYREQLTAVGEIGHAGRFAQTVLRQLPFLGVTTLLGILLLGIDRRTARSRLRKPTGALTVLAVVALGLLLPLEGAAWNRTAVLAVGLLYPLGLTRLLSEWKRREDPVAQTRIVLLVAGLGLPLIMTVGASAGLGKALNGMTLLPFALLWSYASRTNKELPSTDSTESHSGVWALSAVTFASLWLTLSLVHRDAPRRDLGARTEAPFSRSVLTSSSAAEKIDRAVSAIREHAGPQPLMITSGYVALLILIADAVPPDISTHVDLSPLSPRQREDAFRQVCAIQEPVWLLSTTTPLWRERPTARMTERHEDAVRLADATCFEEPVWSEDGWSLRRSRPSP